MDVLASEADPACHYTGCTADLHARLKTHKQLIRKLMDLIRLSDSRVTKALPSGFRPAKVSTYSEYLCRNCSII